MTSPERPVAVLAALAANLGIAVAKFVAFAFTGSSSMVSEGVHSLADSGNQVLLLVGTKRGARAPTTEHPFGYGRTRYIYAFIVSIVLFSLGGVFALYEGWHKVTHPEPLSAPGWAYGVLGISLILEGASLRTAMHEAGGFRAGRSWLSFVHSTKQPELTVVLLEDTGALLGLVFALVGITLAFITGNGRWDGVGSLVIGGLLVVIATYLAREMASLLIGESASPTHVGAIRDALEAGNDVERVIHLRTMHLGPDELLVGAKIAVAHDNTALGIARTIDAAEARVRTAVPIAHVIYLEPDIERPGSSAAPSTGSAVPADPGFNGNHPMNDPDPGRADPALTSALLLDNPVRTYAWGSRTYLPALLGLSGPSEEPWAEIWMGAHPDNPSRLPDGRTLTDLVPRLPFLVKLLAADRPLSIQAHPDRVTAEAGFDAENARGVDRSDPRRTYRDGNHKPELLVALTRVDALCGFRPPAEALELTAALSVPALDDVFAPLTRADPASTVWRATFAALAATDPRELRSLVDQVAAACRWIAETEDGGDEHSAAAFSWVRRLSEMYPGDIGALAPIFLRLLVLAPGDGVFVDAGVMHAYLHGAGIEVQASSDNVLRGGLTEKRIDLPELMRIVRFAVTDDPRVHPERVRDGLDAYPVPADEFAVWRVRPGGAAPLRVPSSGDAIVVCVDGWITVGGVQLTPGRAVFVPGTPEGVVASGLGTAFVTATGRSVPTVPAPASD